MTDEDTAEQNLVPITLSEVTLDQAPSITLEPVAGDETASLPPSPPLPPPVPPPSIGIFQPDATPATVELSSPPSFPKVIEIPAPSKPRLVVLRGMKIDATYPLYPGKNYLGRTDDKPVDIDLDEQEAPDRIWCSRQHAVITFENGQLTIEDLNSLNGSFVNRARVYPGQNKELHENDVIQIGTVHMKLLLG